ncbi:hypothetical protein M3197_08920 [Sporosarcina aquimarina]|uniref:hypothetical protein n=1 Tax=Sporosarcina aquimarina TaxID=114975 RepID=UPI00203D38F0|nr:hypothetical protein [Sporosarcina aquimarina]MCM3757611.1 hypothetical protein [Sporosarcina aquimarina]
MKSRKKRLIYLSVFFSIFLMLTVLYFTKYYCLPEQGLGVTKLVAYVLLIFVIISLGEWFRAFDKNSSRYKKYLFNSLMVIWVLFLLIFFKKIIFNF